MILLEKTVFFFLNPSIFGWESIINPLRCGDILRDWSLLINIFFIFIDQGSNFWPKTKLFANHIWLIYFVVEKFVLLKGPGNNIRLISIAC